MSYDVEWVLRTLEELRADVGPGNEGNDWAFHAACLLFHLERRSQLDRLVEGLPGADGVAERTNAVLIEEPGWPHPRTDDELRELARAYIVDFCARIRSQNEPFEPADIALAAALEDLPVEVAEADVQGTRSGFFMKGSGGGHHGPVEPGPLSGPGIERIAFLEAEDFGLNTTYRPGWGWIYAAFDPLGDQNGHLRSWLLEPATTASLPAQNGFELWRAGAGIRIHGNKVQVVRGDAIPIRNTAYAANES